MGRGLTLALSVAALVWAADSMPLEAQQRQAATLAGQVCASCHGARGRGVSSAFPKLAAQQKLYLETQLKAFRDRTRADPMAQAYMWGMTSQLTDETIAALAAYYAEQTALPGKASDPRLAESGKAIFEAGVAAAGVPACQTCHGPRAEGNAVFPRLAGQYKEYLVKQLVSFKTQIRAEAAAPPMHAVTAGITLAQIEAVATYASGLGK